MLAATSSVSTPPSPITGTYMPPTTIFTPAPDCTILSIIDSCRAYECPASIYVSSFACNIPDRSSSCYPALLATPDFEVLAYTYSPGYYCPLGWASIESDLGSDGVWCCPIGFTLFYRNVYLSIYCRGVLTEGTAFDWSNCDSPTTFPFGPSRTGVITKHAAQGGLLTIPGYHDFYDTRI
ncbi:hypothetical protein F4677DRAFT_373532 [Hypoxylon crocopeplum]|nr:hypothetical protein F4677DRAFT_373532 [Hypoxylon crocopeplum]